VLRRHSIRWKTGKDGDLLPQVEHGQSKGGGICIKTISVTTLSTILILGFGVMSAQATPVPIAAVDIGGITIPNTHSF